ncbi:MAG: ribose 5-phosphate isomerase B [Firmicutes bacterium]|nr:ribose 5-phosphate isomerase B [Bacillota bacterium]MCL2255877.1 ribose 5-phosphate isomerase B [Bacillota bacterium]
MKIALASDHAAVALREKINEHLRDKGVKTNDFGAFDTIAVDYPDFAIKACESVQKGESDVAILVCGTGIGMSMTANKMKGIRAAVCSDTFSAKATRLHNNANVLAIGERVVGMGLALDIVDVFVATQFSKEERHQKRIDKIMKLEN